MMMMITMIHAVDKLIRPFIFVTYEKDAATRAGSGYDVINGAAPGAICFFAGTAEKNRASTLRIKEEIKRTHQIRSRRHYYFSISRRRGRECLKELFHEHDDDDDDAT